MDIDKIVKWARYGEHIPLTCKNHPDLRWSTKNILHIGARTIFYDHEMTEPECDCPLSDLVVVSKPNLRR